MAAPASPRPTIELVLWALLLGSAVFLTILYAILLEDPPFPAVVPAALWFFIFVQTTALWLMRSVAKRPATRWQLLMAVFIALFATSLVSLAGQVGEQERPYHRKDRNIAE